MHRRHFLLGFAATMFSARYGSTLAYATSYQQQTIPLWPGNPPGGGGPVGNGNMHVSAKGAQSQVAVPTLTVLTPSSPNGHGVLIAPGGGYQRIEMAMEGWPAALWLVNRGYTAYLLSYRLPGEGWNDGNLVALQDAQRALRIVTQRERRVSALGFSAGGHLLGMAATRPDYQSYPAVDALDKHPATMSGAALIYPIITLEKPYTHTATHKILLGREASQKDNAVWSVQRYVTPETPPIFLVQAEDDSVSDPQNTLIMQAACLREQVPVTMYRYPTGGHGFAMGKPGTATVEWPGHYATWLRALN